MAWETPSHQDGDFEDRNVSLKFNERSADLVKISWACDVGEMLIILRNLASTWLI